VKPADLTFPSCALAFSQRATLAEHVQKLYEEHYQSCYRFLVLSGSSADEAVELLQEAFLRLYQTLKDGAKLDKPRSWLIRVLQRLRIDEFRRSSRMSSFADFPEELWRRADTPSLCNPEMDLLDRERTERLQNAVRQLTPTQYQYLALRAEGLKFREIADLYGVSVGSVFDACGRALKKLGRLANA
jgi:RNA polymerase sigma-70 factor, ECF subfamily